MIWHNYVLVVNTSVDSWHAMSIDLDIIIEIWERNPKYYRIEKWHWARDEASGDNLYKTEIIKEAL